MPALWIEMGCEELPARWVEGLARQMADRTAAGLRAARLLAADAEAEVRWTPRRLVAKFAAIPAQQPGQVEELVGPPAAIAFAADGSVTKQGAGFAAKNGMPAEALYRTKTAKGEYAALRRESRGEPAATVLAAALPGWIEGMDLPKAMRWDGGGFKFVRPVRWWSVLLDGEVVAANLGGLAAGRRTRPHPTLGGVGSGLAVEIAAADQAEATLAKGFVVLDPAERRRRIVAGIEAALAGSGRRARPDDGLLATLVNLTEWPAVVAGSFDAAFLRLPAEVLVTVMRDHQKYFAVEEATEAAPGMAKLAPQFLAVMDLDADRDGLVRHGNERVLRARFKDAEFFWQADRKRSLASRVDDLRAVTFHARLGSYLDKTQRVARLARELAEPVGADAEAAARAALLAKCDLTTELVKEFTELQGVMGGLYAQADGESQEVWQAIYDQYGDQPRTAAGAALGIADRLDTLAGLFAVGEIPTGSRDPFALRRAANAVIRICAERKLHLMLSAAVRQAQIGLARNVLEGALEGLGQSSPEETGRRLMEFFAERQEHYLREAGFGDLAAAVIAAAPDDITQQLAHAKALEQLRAQNRGAFLKVAAALKRMRNIVRKEDWESEAVNPALLTAPEERRLRAAVEAIARDRGPSFPPLRELTAIADLWPILDAFFDAVRVNDPDPAIRANRLGLLAWAGRELSQVADFSQIIIPGE
jgi:glycyl-tRNA synthetase beta chain